MKGLLLTTKTGGFISLGRPITTHYQGLFFMLRDELELYKTVEDIGLDLDVTKLENSANSFIRYSGKVKEVFSFDDSSTLRYKITNYTGYIGVSLDFRRVHDFSDTGRIYKVLQEKDVLIIVYEKYEDDSLSELKEKKTLKIKGVKDYEYKENWASRNYAYDLQRKTRSDFFVNDGLRIKVEGSIELLFCFDEKPVPARFLKPARSDLDICYNAVCSLKYEDKFSGLFAGLPWFYQFWARDELIGLKPFIIRKEYDFVFEVLMRHLSRIDENGYVKNRYPESELGSVDSLGWLAFRFYELFNSKSFDKKMLLKVKAEFESALEKLSPKFKDSLLFNEDLETWMDTSNENDFRRGFRVEIQALILSVYRLINFINKELGLEENKVEFEMKKKVKEKLFVDYLRDGFLERPSNTIRPNVFLAYYLYPELLGKKEWEKTFDVVLKNCWLEWGGLSSISKNHRLFRDTYTGITNESYHRGDSWFFVNNIAGLCMKRLNQKKYSKYIKKIVSASTTELKQLGAIGHHAEVCSAKKLGSKGCFAQLWSSATLFELLTEL